MEDRYVINCKICEEEAEFIITLEIIPIKHEENKNEIETTSNPFCYRHTQELINSINYIPKKEN